MRLPFWSDDFDMDLLKVIPGVEDLLGETADQVLYTHGSMRHGRLNHPSVWNHTAGLVAFCGFTHAQKPQAFYTSDPVVECTFLELLRSQWPQGWSAIIEGHLFPSISAGDASRDFELLMWHVRGWERAEPVDVQAIAERVHRRLRHARELLGLLVLGRQMGVPT